MKWTDTLSVIPNGVQTESKMPSRHVEGVYPKYIIKGNGAYVWDEDGKKYVDYTCSLGTNLLGHADPAIVKAVLDQAKEGTSFGLPNPKETDLALKLTDYIPSAEMVRFVTTGSEATSAAVKLARAYTGKKVILCCGYHGWHDWYGATTDRPRGTNSSHVHQFKYNDYAGFEKLMKKYKDKVAGVIMEPYILDKPKANFVLKIRKACTETKAVLIFDEVITAFRTEKGTAQAMFNITPDLTCIGKALGNGVPIAAVCGQEKIMSLLADDVFVSSTFGGNLLGVAAGLAVMDELQKPIIRHIWSKGEVLRGRFNSYFEGTDGVECIGYPCRTFFKFPTEMHKSLFWQECLREGVFFGYAQFVSASHDVTEMDITLAAMRRGAKIVKKYWDDPEKRIEGKCASATARMINTKEGA